MANMAFSVLQDVTAGGLMIVVHSHKAPSDSEWDAYFTELVKHDPEKLRSLVFTDGGALNTAQRKQVNDFLKGRSSPCAVVTSNTIVRGVVTALGWFNPKIRSFAPSSANAAMQYLTIDPSDFSRVRRQLDLLRREFGSVPVQSLSAAL
jgi:hypothetical protein